MKEADGRVASPRWDGKAGALLLLHDNENAGKVATRL
jgi:hypothetical protein